MWTQMVGDSDKSGWQQYTAANHFRLIGKTISAFLFLLFIGEVEIPFDEVLLMFP